jgi:hypothetical protein
LKEIQAPQGKHALLDCEGFTTPCGFDAFKCFQTAHRRRAGTTDRKGKTMLRLPKKPKIKIGRAGDNQYLITFLGRIKNEHEFNDMLYNHIEKALGVGDTLKDPHWRSKSVTISTNDIRALERRLVFFEISAGITIHPDLNEGRNE